MNFPQEHIAILSEILNRHIYKPGLCSQKVSKIAGVAKDDHILTWIMLKKSIKDSRVQKGRPYIKRANRVKM